MCWWLQAQLSIMESRAGTALADLAEQQARADTLDRQLTQARAQLTAAPAAGPAADAATAAATAAAEVAAAEAAGAAAAAEQLHERNTELRKEVHSLKAHVRRLTSDQDAAAAGGGPRPPSAADLRCSSAVPPQTPGHMDGSLSSALPRTASEVCSNTVVGRCIVTSHFIPSRS